MRDELLSRNLPPRRFSIWNFPKLRISCRRNDLLVGDLILRSRVALDRANGRRSCGELDRHRIMPHRVLPIVGQRRCSHVRDGIGDAGNRDNNYSFHAIDIGRSGPVSTDFANQKSAGQNKFWRGWSVCEKCGAGLDEHPPPLCEDCTEREALTPPDKRSSDPN